MSTETTCEHTNTHINTWKHSKKADFNRQCWFLIIVRIREVIYSTADVLISQGSIYFIVDNCKTSTT